MGIFFKSKDKKQSEINTEARDNDSSYVGTESLSISSLSGLSSEMSPEKSLRICTVNACVRVIANAFSTLPINTYENLPNKGRKLAEDFKLYWLLKYQPNDDQDAVVFKEKIIIGLLLWGNAYVQIVRDKQGRIVELYALDSANTKKLKTGGNKTIYSTTRDDQPIMLPKCDVMHITTLEGRNPISLVSDTLGGMFQMQERNEKFWANNANPSGVLKYKGRVTRQMLENIRRSWDTTYSGASNSGKTLILEQDMDFQPITITQQQAQFIETLKLDGNQICGMFSVPPHKIGFLDNATYSNIEEQNISFVTDCLQPLIVRCETAMMSSLLSETEAKRYKFEFNLDSQLRGKALERAQKLQIERQNGVISIDEWRALENRNPLPKKMGDIYQVPMNMDTLGDGIEPDPNDPKNPPSVFGQQGVNPSEPTDNTAPEAKSIFMPIVKRTIEQCLRKESKMKVEKRTSLEEETYIFDTFKPIYEAICLASKCDFRANLVSKFASEWVQNNSIGKIEESFEEKLNLFFNTFEEIKGDL